MKKTGKILTSALALALTVGPMSTSAVEKSLEPYKDLHKSQAHSESGLPFDLAIANDERLIEMLKENGKIAKDASPAEAEKGLKKFLKAKSESAKKESGELADEKKKN
ncbi:hypothetical protein LD39_15095, partial [Halobacillus sp. BBL2006]